MNCHILCLSLSPLRMTNTVSSMPCERELEIRQLGHASRGWSEILEIKFEMTLKILYYYCNNCRFLEGCQQSGKRKIILASYLLFCLLPCLETQGMSISPNFQINFSQQTWYGCCANKKYVCRLLLREEERRVKKDKIIMVHNIKMKWKQRDSWSQVQIGDDN